MVVLTLEQKLEGLMMADIELKCSKTLNIQHSMVVRMYSLWTRYVVHIVCPLVTNVFYVLCDPW